MKGLIRGVSAVAVLAGLALLAAILYDVSEVWRALGLQAWTDEATVALLGLLLAGSMVSGGAIALRRSVRVSRV